MNRSKWKGPYVSSVLKDILIARKKKKRYLKIYDKGLYIMPFFIGLTLQVYNGKKFIKLKVTDNMVGYKIGEFVFTRNKLKS